MTDRDLPSPLAQITEVTQFELPFTFGGKEDFQSKSKRIVRSVKARRNQNYLKEFQKVSAGQLMRLDFEWQGGVSKEIDIGNQKGLISPSGWHGRHTHQIKTKHA